MFLLNSTKNSVVARKFFFEKKLCPAGTALYTFGLTFQNFTFRHGLMLLSTEPVGRCDVISVFDQTVLSIRRRLQLQLWPGSVQKGKMARGRRGATRSPQWKNYIRFCLYQVSIFTREYFSKGNWLFDNYDASWRHQSYIWAISRAWIVQNKKESSIFLKI